MIRGVHVALLLLAIYNTLMARHSKWHNIQVRKGAMDSRRGKVFTKHAKLIEVAAREGGGDPETNATLRAAIDNARAFNVPNANVERAIKKGTGELKEGNALTEVFFEGYGPEGVALYIQVVTDNRNRAVGNIKTLLSKNGGAMGEAGSVSWMFERKGLIELDAAGADIDALQLSAIDAGATDVKVEGERIYGGVGFDTSVDKDAEAGVTVSIYTEPSHLPKVKKVLADFGFRILSSEVLYVPKTEIQIRDAKKAQRILELLELLEEDEDVTNVYSNVNITDEAKSLAIDP